MDMKTLLEAEASLVGDAHLAFAVDELLEETPGGGKLEAAPSVAADRAPATFAHLPSVPSTPTFCLGDYAVEKDVLRKSEHGGRPGYERPLMRVVLERRDPKKLGARGLGRLDPTEVEAPASGTSTRLEEILTLRPWLVVEMLSIADIPFSGDAWSSVLPPYCPVLKRGERPGL